MSKFAHKTSCPLPTSFRSLGPPTLTLQELNELFAYSLTAPMIEDLKGIYDPVVANGTLVKFSREMVGDSTLVSYRFFTTIEAAEAFQTAFAAGNQLYFSTYPDIVSGYTDSIETFTDEDYGLVVGNVDLVTRMLIV